MVDVYFVRTIIVMTGCCKYTPLNRHTHVRNYEEFKKMATNYKLYLSLHSPLLLLFHSGTYKSLALHLLLWTEDWSPDIRSSWLHYYPGGERHFAREFMPSHRSTLDLRCRLLEEIEMISQPATGFGFHIIIIILSIIILMLIIHAFQANFTLKMRWDAASALRRAYVIANKCLVCRHM